MCVSDKMEAGTIDVMGFRSRASEPVTDEPQEVDLRQLFEMIDVDGSGTQSFEPMKVCAKVGFGVLEFVLC